MRRNTISPTLRGKGRDGGIDEPYGRARIVSTDPNRSNSGFMFAGLVLSLMSGDVATQELLAQRGDQAKAIFRSMGLKSSSSGKLLDQYIAAGLGAEPMVIGYENQLVEWALADPARWQRVQAGIGRQARNPLTPADRLLGASADRHRSGGRQAAGGADQPQAAASLPGPSTDFAGRSAPWRAMPTPSPA